LESIPVGGSVDDSQFDPEQRRFLREKRNELDYLRVEVHKTEKDEDLENEVVFLRQDIVRLKAESAELAKLIRNSASNKKKNDDIVAATRAQRKETGNQIRAFMKVAKDAENARAALILRRDAVNEASNPDTGLPSIVENIRRELDRIEVDGAAVEEAIREYEERMAGLKTQPKLSAREQEKSAEWMLGMDENLESIQEESREKKSELKRKLKYLAKLETRYQKLYSMVLAWRKRIAPDPEYNEETTVDALLAQIPQYEKAPVSARRAELENCILTNGETEAQIGRLKRELAQALQGLNHEEGKLKKQILDQKRLFSDREKALVEEIRSWRLKKAQKSLR
jgi:hypothetical protein